MTQEYFGQDDGVPRENTAYGGSKERRTEGEVRLTDDDLAKIPLSKLVTIDTSQTAIKIETANRAVQDDRFALNREFYYIAPGMSRIFTVRVAAFGNAQFDDEGNIQVVRNEDGARCWVHPRNLRTQAEVLSDITAARFEWPHGEPPERVDVICQTQAADAPQETVAPLNGAWHASLPDKPGYYWYRETRHDHSGQPSVVRIDGDGDCQFCGNEIYYRPGASFIGENLQGEFWSIPLKAPR